MDKCDFPRCIQIPLFGYIQRIICEKHWVQLCEADDNKKKSLLKKIDLTLNDKGSVIPISHNKKN